ncbi:MAG TPA: endolytic transglycosylase MltG [Nevskiaceae bacterium]|nr:endolytic transglycosylase MltG [Nevskiaceae bacterium]
MRYTKQSPKRRWPRRVCIVVVGGILLVVLATAGVRHMYFENLKPVSSSQETVLITVKKGASVDDIADQLQQAGLIRSAWAFKLYVSNKEARNALQAGTYGFEPSQSAAEIVAQLTHGKVATDLVTILPGQRLDKIRSTLINDGFSEADVDSALNPAQYADNPALVDKPAGANLEGYLYPDSFQKTADTTAKEIILESLKEMQNHLTPDLRTAYANQGLSTYQAIILASVVEQEVSKQTDRTTVAQVFLKRMRIGMPLGSDVTAYYGAVLAGQKPSTTYDSAYNTLLHKGLPPTPISNVSTSSLQAVAHPAGTDWLYFVTGDDGVTHFSKTLADHEALTAQYCHKLCGQ